MGTNAGFQRMAGHHSGTTAKDLACVRNRYITVSSLRQAIAIVANGTLSHGPIQHRRLGAWC
jgi:hypothetical protein